MDPRFQVGKKFRETFLVDLATVEKFAELSGDLNPLHLVESEAQAYGFKKQVAHGALQAAFVSKLIGMQVPGEGALWTDLTIGWPQPVFVGDSLTLEIEIVSASEATRGLKLELGGKNQDGVTVMKGSASVRMAKKLNTSDTNKRTGKRVALVTGGAGGIGSEIARRLAAEGIRVAIAFSSSRQRAEDVVGEIEAAEGEAIALEADLSVAGGAITLVEETVQRWGRLDIVVHGASPGIEPAPIASSEYGAFASFTDFYLRNAHEFVAAASPGMTDEDFGRFIFIGTSYTSGEPPAGLAAYCAAKAALAAFSKSAAVELGPAGITSNVVSPGMTLTSFAAHVPQRIKEVEAMKNPVRRLANPGDTAPVVAFLASEEAGYINGAEIPVAGKPL